MPRLLFGPCDDPGFIDQFLREPEGRWTVFGARTPSWEAAEALCKGGPPDALLVWPSYASVPAWVWTAPVPVVALAADPNLLWHSYKHILPLADLALTDAPSAERFRRAGIEHVRAVNLFGIDRYFAAAVNEPEGERDIDLLFVGNFNPMIQGERLPWIGRLAALADKCKVVITTGVYGADYRALLRRARLVFNRSIRGECNLRALEAAASGAVLLQEAENAEVGEYLRPGVEFAPYTADDLESVVARLLANEGERRSIAEAARDRARRWTFEALIREALGVDSEDWGEVKERARERRNRQVTMPLAGRIWQRASGIGADVDLQLIGDLTAAGDRHALGVLANSAAEAERYFAAVTDNRVSAVSRAVVLAELGRKTDALTACRQVLESLEAGRELTPREADSVPYPPRYYWLRAAWERAGYDHPDDPTAERREKARLLRGRAMTLVAELTGEVRDWEAAIECCPQWFHLRVGLGTALMHAGRPDEAAERFRLAYEKNPFDNAIAQALVGSLAAAGRSEEAERVRAHRRLLSKAAPKLIAEIRTVPVPIVPEPNRVASPTASPAARTAVANPPQPLTSSTTPTPQPTKPRTRFVDLSRDAFHTRFGSPDTGAALCAFTPPTDTHVVLTLVAHLRPRRVLVSLLRSHATNSGHRLC